MSYTYGESNSSLYRISLPPQQVDGPVHACSQCGLPTRTTVCAICNMTARIAENLAADPDYYNGAPIMLPKFAKKPYMGGLKRG